MLVHIGDKNIEKSFYQVTWVLHVPYEMFGRACNYPP